MNDIYNKPDKAGEKQQLRSRKALLEDELVRIKNEKINILEEIIKIDLQLNNM